MNINIDKQKWKRDAIAKAMPVARKWLFSQMAEGLCYDDLEEEFLNISFIEVRLYGSMKNTLISHIQRHGLDAKSLELFEQFKACEEYDRNQYLKVLKKVRRAFVADPENRSLEYLISKITEYIEKVTNVGKSAFEMLQKGNSPDLDAWSDKVVLNDNLFEENKQFLKQTLHHLEVLERNRTPIGIPELRLLFYHKQGCKREKLYRQVEDWFVKIYYDLPTKEEKKIACEEICRFVAEIVPQVGYISPSVIGFILSGGYISQTSHDLLVEIQPVVTNLGMNALVTVPLRPYYKQAIEHRVKGGFTETDGFVMDIMRCYDTKVNNAKFL